ANAIKNLTSQSVNSSIRPTLAIELSLLETITSPGTSIAQSPAPIQRVATVQAAVQPSRAAQEVVVEPSIAPESKLKNDLNNDHVESETKQEKVAEDAPAAAATPVSPPSDLAEAWQQTLVTVFDQNK